MNAQKKKKLFLLWEDLHEGCLTSIPLSVYLPKKAASFTLVGELDLPAAAGRHEN